MLKNGIFCGLVILVVFKVFLVVKNLEILIQIVPERSIYSYFEPWSTKLAQKSTKLKTNSTNSVSLNIKLNQLLFEQIIKQVFEKLFNHIPHAVRPNLSSVQIIALTHLGSNHDGVSKLFIRKARDICLMHTPSINRIDGHLADLTTYKKLNSDPTQAIRNDVLSTLDFLHSTHPVYQRTKNDLTPQGTSCTFTFV